MDVLGTPFFVVCTKASDSDSVSDDDGLLAMLKQHKAYFLQLPIEHRVTILLDNGYHKDFLEQQLEQIDPLPRGFVCQRIKIELADQPTQQQQEVSKQNNPAKQGFVVIQKRWIVERTNAWINQCRVLWKNCEGLLRTSEAKIRLCAIRLILRRLA